MTGYATEYAASGQATGGSALWKHARSRERLGRVAAILGDADLEMEAVNDLLWDEIVSIEQGAVSVNHEVVKDAARVLTPRDLLAERFVVLRRGKKTYSLIDIAA